MFLPTKGVTAERALLTVGAEILGQLDHPMSVSTLWHQFDSKRGSSAELQRITFDWFSLALSALYTLELIGTSDDGYLVRNNVH